MAVLPKLAVEFAPFTAPLAASPQWEDITAYVKSFSISRGRQHELSRVEAGTCDLLLKDYQDRRFDPENTMSLYYGNLLTVNQSSFESGTTGWAPQSGGNCTLATSTAQKIDGAQSMTMTTVAGAQMSAETPRGTSGIPVAPGSVITGIASFRANSLNRDVRVAFTYFNSAGTFIGFELGSLVGDTTGAWATATVTDTVPTDAAYVNLVAYVFAGAVGEIHYVDNASVHGGSFIFGGPATTWYSPTVRGLRPMKKLRISAKWNLLTVNQASVETDTTGFGSPVNCTAARSSTQAADGASSLRLSSTAAGMMQVRTTPLTDVAVTPRQSYTALASFRAALTGRSVQVEIFWYTSASAFISSVQGTAVNDTTGGWTQATVTATAPATAAHAVVVLTVNTTGGASELHYIDKIGLFPAPDITTWSAGGPYYLFTGYVTAWPMIWANDANTEVHLTAVDGFKVLELKKVASTAYRTEVLADSPRFWYRLGEVPVTVLSVGTTPIADSSGNGRTGLLVQDATADKVNVGFGATGLLPVDATTSTSFDDTAGFQCDGITGGNFITTGTVTLECWIKTTSVGERSRFLVAGNLADFFVSLGVDAAGLPEVRASDNVSTYALAGTTAITDGRPHHVAVTRASNGTTYRLYVDGVQVATSTAGFVANVSSSPGPVFHIAASIGGGGITTEYTGQMQDVAAYTTELSAARILAHFDAGAGDWLTVKLSGARITDILDVVGWPAADRVLDAGQFQMRAVTEPLHTQSALSAIQSIVESEGYPAIVFVDGQGRIVFQDRSHATPALSTTLGDGTGELPVALGAEPVMDDLDVWNILVYQAVNGIAQIVSDGTSGDDYVERTLPKTGLQNASDADVLTMATADLARYKNAVTRLKSLTFQPAVSPGAMYYHALGRELNDRIVFNRAGHPGGGIATSLDLRIEGIDTDGGPTTWDTVWHFVPT